MVVDFLFGYYCLVLCNKIFLIFGFMKFNLCSGGRLILFLMSGFVFVLVFCMNRFGVVSCLFGVLCWKVGWLRLLCLISLFVIFIVVCCRCFWLICWCWFWCRRWLLWVMI